MTDRWDLVGKTIYSGILEWRVENGKNTEICIGRHSHAAVELIYVMDGSFLVESDAGVYIASAGTLVVFNANEVHYGWIDREHPYVRYTFAVVDLKALQTGIHLTKNKTIDDLLTMKIRFCHYITDRTLAAEIGKSLCVIAEKYEETDNPGAEMIAHGNASIAVGLLISGRHVIPFSEQEQINAFTNRIHVFVEENYTHEITKEDILRAFPYSHSHFCRLFKNRFGVSFTGYLRKYRIGKAMEMMQSDIPEERTISEIALLVGFADYCYFTHSFKEIVGMTPRAYLHTCVRSEQR